MANDIVLLDTGILIDHIRSLKKSNTRFFALNDQYAVAISTITGFELLIGKTPKNRTFTEGILIDIPILNFNAMCMEQAVTIYQSLKKKNKLIQPLDIFIAATALAYDLPVATLSTEHFQRIPDLKLI